jgi:hypothetical protein
MPFIIAAAFAVVSLVVLSIAVVTTIRAEAREGTGAAASFTYRAYSA